MDDSIIQARGLTRRYGQVLAVDHVDFAVRRGEIFGFLGPNGAGKTTTVRMLTGYLPPSDGSAVLDGHDVAAEPTQARQHIGVVPEEANVYVSLTVWQNLMLMAELHGVPRARRRQRGGELLDLLGLADRVRQKGRALSKGLRQRLMLGMALVSDPAILFLDEPTTGLDVASTRLIRQRVLSLNQDHGVTVFLTTHNIEEADRLCHRVAIISHGRIAAIDTPAALRGAVDSRRSVEVAFREAPQQAQSLAEGIADAEVVATANGLRVYTCDPGRAAQEIATRAAARGLRIETIRTLEPSLEDVFLHVTGTGDAPAKEAADERAR